MLNCCPACFYVLEDDPDLEFSHLFDMDGGNSLKRTGATVRRTEERADARLARSDYLMDAAEVDLFKDEVPARSVNYSPIILNFL
jgi:hypothetical protein